MRDKKLLAALIVVVVVIWLAAPVALFLAYSSLENRGQFGDLFGSVTALFTGLAFAGLFYTIHLQAKQLRVQQSELKLQRQELRLQRKEMAASRAELANQVEMQRALIKATIAQIAVAAINAHIEAKKMESERLIPDARKDYWTFIETSANALSALADKLEGEIPNAR